MYHFVRDAPATPVLHRVSLLIFQLHGSVLDSSTALILDHSAAASRSRLCSASRCRYFSCTVSLSSFQATLGLIIELQRLVLDSVRLAPSRAILQLRVALVNQRPSSSLCFSRTFRSQLSRISHRRFFQLHGFVLDPSCDSFLDSFTCTFRSRLSLSKVQLHGFVLDAAAALILVIQLHRLVLDFLSVSLSIFQSNRFVLDLPATLVLDSSVASSRSRFVQRRAHLARSSILQLHVSFSFTSDSYSRSLFPQLHRLHHLVSIFTLDSQLHVLDLSVSPLLIPTLSFDLSDSFCRFCTVRFRVRPYVRSRCSPPCGPECGSHRGPPRQGFQPLPHREQLSHQLSPRLPLRP